MPLTARNPGPLNPTAASLLGFLHSGAATGDELLAVAEAMIGDFWHLTRSQVYRELAALAEHGLVRAGEPGPRSRRAFELTAAGREAFTRWLAEPPGGEQIRYPLLLTLAFGGHLDGGLLREHLTDHRIEHEGRLTRYLELDRADALDDYQRATLSFGIHYERAVLAWMDDLRRLLKWPAEGE